jgi:deoxyribodipyrimidine photo-lyase
MSAGKVLVYLLRRDLRVSDNPILHRLATSKDHGCSQLLPVYVFPAHQIEISGFLKEGEASPYPEARGDVSGFWRCGPHRTKFIAESVWDLKEALNKAGSGLALRAGRYQDVLEDLIEGLRKHGHEVGAVWMVSEEGVEEKRDEKAIRSVCSSAGVDLQIFPDEKHYIDEWVD